MLSIHQAVITGTSLPFIESRLQWIRRAQIRTLITCSPMHTWHPSKRVQNTMSSGLSTTSIVIHLTSSASKRMFRLRVSFTTTVIHDLQLIRITVHEYSYPARGKAHAEHSFSSSANAHTGLRANQSERLLNATALTPHAFDFNLDGGYALC